MSDVRVILLEDEQYAADALIELLAQIQPNIQVLAVLESVRQALDWFQKNPSPDLILADIQLADGLSFRIFEQTQIQTPVIFTTAFDAYAIKAFQVNSLHYLLKPVDAAELRQALQKFEKNRSPQALAPEWGQLAAFFKPTPNWRSRFTVQQGESLFYIETADIAYFEGDDRYVVLTTRQGKRHIIDYLLRDLETLLDPKRFFRINRSFIVQIDAIESITLMSKSRLTLRLKPAAKREVIVSAATASEFKAWLEA
ncbi:MAG: response regulator transcription factor [Saprospiraceae bacterium]|nr:response regulator transcription factor [Saprospiraceae bacterium]